MIKIFSLVIFFIAARFSQPLYAETFTFSNNEQQWSFYGDGLGHYTSSEGRVDALIDGLQSMRLSCDWGENQTAFYEWKNLRPGLYKITYYVKASDLQLGPDKVSLWNFFDGGNGTETILYDLQGSFNWRRVQKTIEVKKSALTMWFRLKGPGQIWIDDFSMERTTRPSEELSLSEPEEKNSDKKKSEIFPPAITKAMTTKLYQFDENEDGHPFSIKKISAQNGVGVFSPQKFYDFSVSSMPITNWQGYDRIEMDIFNPNDNFAEIIITLADDKSVNYWTQTNHKQTLGPGWNKIGFSLTQFVGERGSHRHLRPTDLSSINKFHLIVDPDAKSSFKHKSFFIDNIKLSANPPPLPPVGIRAYDFTTHKSFSNTGMEKVTTQTLYNEERGFGFVEPQFWKVEDSQYASEALRYSIGLIDGHFKIRLPNGTYKLNLIIDKLGFWDVPFWKDRSFYANGKILFKESRINAHDFVKDLLRFENIEPLSTDNPFDLYFAKTFNPVEQKVEVTNGILDLWLEGDASGIALNTLVLWPENEEAKARKFISALESRHRLEYNWLMKPLRKSTTALASAKSPSVEVVVADLSLAPDNLRTPVEKKLKFISGVGERPYQVVQLFGGATDQVFEWSLSPITGSNGAKINPSSFEIHEVIYQYTSPDLNHETYMLTGKYLKKLNDNKMRVAKNSAKYLWMQLKLNNSVAAGFYKGEIVFKQAQLSFKLPVQIQVMPYELPKVDFPVGFFGLDPLPKTYYSGKGYEEVRKKFRFMSLQRLSEGGFTTFTGLPEAKVTSVGGKLSLDVTDLDELFSQAKKLGFSPTLFSYGGSFPQNIIDMSQKPAEMNENNYVDQVSSLLKKVMTKASWPAVVHTFSDEAGGYSDRVTEDMAIAGKLKKQYPFLSLGGFGNMNDTSSDALNKTFDYGFYSQISESSLKRLKEQKRRWGLYNTAPGNLDDPRNTFGAGLYLARKSGLSHFLEWNSSGFNNYPYYEMDGREADVALFYPSSDGRLHSSLRFEFAAEGLQFYRKLVLLEKSLAKNHLDGPAKINARLWLEKLSKGKNFQSTLQFIEIKKLNFKRLNDELNDHLGALYSQKILTNN